MRGLTLVFVLGCIGCLMRGGGPADDPDAITDPGRGDRPHGCTNGCRSGQVCARTGTCLPPDQVRAIHVSWTVSGQPASETSCARARDLRIDFNSTSGSAGLSPGLSYAPVPCVEGRFSVDKSPVSIDHVALGRELGGGQPREAMIDATTGEASLDLPY